jgi:hypothetical protein
LEDREMMYFDEMRTKYGFGDGSAVPQGADKYREVYVKALNVFAEQFNSEVRAYPFDRGGAHNYCLILFRDKNSTENEDLDPDDGMLESIDKCVELGLDDYLEVTVNVLTDSLEDFLTNYDYEED